MSDYLNVEEEGISAEEKEHRERLLVELKRPIGPGDSVALVIQKCNFQDSVKYEYASIERFTIEHLLPSRRRG